MNDLRNATLAARDRLQNKNLGTRVNQGRFQIIEATYGKRGVSTIKELSTWMSGFEVLAALNRMEA